jgi:hydroxymethylbilane synthase
VTDRLRIGTRGSRLALAQAEWVRRRLEEVHGGLRAELVIIRTSGDRFVDRPLIDIGGKGLFVKEIEEALSAGEIDCAVHSMKDLPAELAAGLVLACVPAREDPRDVLITRLAGGLQNLPSAARVGTSSLRRAALLHAARPDLDVSALRGNVDTRLRKLAAGEVDAIVLARAGLNRMGLDPEHAEVCDPAEFVPAIGQGALALESRPDATCDRLAALEHAPTRRAVTAERALLVAVGGSCVTPLAAHATIEGGHLKLRAVIAAPDGSRIVRGEAQGPETDPERIGSDLAQRLLARGGAEILAALEAR